MSQLITSFGGAGSGGSIRLVANRIEGSGALTARNGNNSATEGLGRIRTEAFVVGLTTPTNPTNVSAPPLGVSLPNPRQIRIVSVAGQAVPQPPGGSTIAPDVVFNQAGFVAINLATTNIPMGTVIRVRVTTGGRVLTADSTPTNAAGNAVASLEVPAGVGTIQAFADYVPAGN
jgi:hypothetical protein